MKILKTLLYVLAGVVVILQFFRPPRNAAEVNSPQSIGAAFDVPADVQSILQTACLDCHSNSTRYPWYAEIQPVGWWLNGHITDAKKHLNFSEFTGRRLRWQHHKMEEVIEQVKADMMPLPSYTLLHRDAVLTPEQKQTLIAWAEGIRRTLEQQYPDSIGSRK